MERRSGVFIFCCGLKMDCFCLVVKSCPTLCNPMDCSPPGSSVHGGGRISPGRNIGVGCHALLQRIFPTQGSNPGFLHCWRILCHLSQQGSPRILQWVAYLFSSRSSRPGIEPVLHCWWSLPAELPGKHRSAGEEGEFAF